MFITKVAGDSNCLPLMKATEGDFGKLLNFTVAATHSVLWLSDTRDTLLFSYGEVAPKSLPVTVTQSCCHA